MHSQHLMKKSPPQSPHLAHYNHPRMDADTDGQADAILRVKTGLQRPEGLDHP